MTEYHFESPEFGISDDGIHLLRSGFNYETIAFSQVDSLTIEKGRELNNWPVILAIGLALLSFGVYYMIGLFDVLVGDELNVIYIEETLVPLGPLLLGGYCVYTSMKNGTVLRIRTIKGKTDKFPLRHFEKQLRLKPLQSFLIEKLATRVSVNA